MIDGIPILLAPEVMGDPAASISFNLQDPRYAEAYEEMAHYSAASLRMLEDVEFSDSRLALDPLVGTQGTPEFLSPAEPWLDATFDCASQLDVYDHVGDPSGQRILQVGGSGIHAVKLLLAGADEGWLLTPVLGEAQYAMALAKSVGVERSLRCVVGTGEELPFASESFQALISGGCLHHMVTDLAFVDAARVLAPGGRLAAFDPWRAPLYGVGIKVFGKREPAVFCRPLTMERVASLGDSFEFATTIHHGALTRYLMIALSKFGLSPSISRSLSVTRRDDAIADRIPGLRAAGSSVAVLATKAAR